MGRRLGDRLAQRIDTVASPIADTPRSQQVHSIVRKNLSFPVVRKTGKAVRDRDHVQITPTGKTDCWICGDPWLIWRPPHSRNHAPVPGDDSWSIPLPTADARDRRTIPVRPGPFPTLREDPVPRADPPSPGGPVDYVAIQRSAAFTDLRRRRTGFVLPATIGFMAWYLTYVLLAAYAPGFMAVKLFGQINIGLVLGVLQFASTVLITTWYTRFARGTLDPRVDAIRQHAGDTSS